MSNGLIFANLLQSALRSLSGLDVRLFFINGFAGNILPKGNDGHDLDC